MDTGCFGQKNIDAVSRLYAECGSANRALELFLKRYGGELAEWKALGILVFILGCDEYSSLVERINSGCMIFTDE